MFPSPADVSGRRVVITGSTGGLGVYLAEAFHEAGAKLVLVARGADELQQQADQLGSDCIAVPADIATEEGNEKVAAAAVEEFGGVDVWICNAGISPILAGPIETPVDVWKRVMDVNLTGVFLGARAAAKVMSDGGRIIVTSSVLGARQRRGLSAYSASKAGAIGLVKTLAIDLAPSGITVNAVSPGWFESPMTEGWLNNDKLNASIIDHTPLGRWGTREDLPGIYLFLASPAAEFVTGTVLTVDGGYEVG